jgi:hypothetical protein
MNTWLTAAVICGLATTGFADARSERAERADQLFKKGRRLLADKKYPEACTAFEDSDKIDPGIGAKLNVARCYEEWGKLATAWQWYADAEQMARTAKDDRAPRIHTLITELDATVPRLTIKLPPGARTQGVSVKLDGVNLAISALGSERRVDPGPHQIDTLIGGESQTKVIPVERGGSSEITIDVPVERTEPRQSAAEVSDSGTTADPLRNRRLLGLGIGGAGVVAIGVAGIVVLRAHGDYDHAIGAHCSGAHDLCDDTGLAATRSARHRANIATVVTIGGLAAVGGGVYLYLTSRHAAPSDDHAFYVAPAVGDASGLVLGGAF